MITNSNPVFTRERTKVINGVTYFVSSSFKESATETAEQKLMQYVSECISRDFKSQEKGLNKG